MKEILTKIYNKPQKPRVVKVIPEENVSFKVDYIDGVTCEILGESAVKYYVRFIDAETEETIHQGFISVNCWISPNRKWYTKWRVVISKRQGGNPHTNKTPEMKVFYEELNLKDKKVLISFDSSSLGDNIAWIPYVEEFRRKHDCEVSCSTFFNDLFEKEYPEIKFVPVDSVLENAHASYKIGWFDNWENKEKNPNDLRTIPLQQTASDILRLEHKEIKTKINIESTGRLIEEKYVCISTSSTAGCKHWHRWQEIVDYLNSEGYKVVVIQKEPLDFIDLDGLENVIHPDTKNIQEAVTWLYNCEFFIGISSGVSWLAWALNKKVILISGFTDAFHEFSTPHRVINKDVCNSCWQNTNFLFDKGDWDWCPIHKGTDRQFECAKSITFDIVKKEIDKLRIGAPKIGIQFLAYNCKKSFPEFIEPWEKLKDEYGLYFYVGSAQFPIYANLGYEDNNASTVEMLKNEYSNIIDYLYTPSEPEKEEDIRNKCLEIFKSEEIDLMWVVDSDEFFTEEEIRNVLDYVKQNNHIDWYSLQYKNYVGDGEGWVDFEAPRLWWMNRNEGISDFYRDCWVIYNNNKECRQVGWQTIPKEIAMPRHMTWVADFEDDVRAKIKYQNVNYSGGCGFKWDEEKSELSLNEEWFESHNEKMPEIHH